MSALFGHTKGAFTGAIADRPGLLKAADAGMLFLDEVGELGLDEQAMLLRAVEEKTFLPVGADREVQSCFQLICGTNRDLARSVAAGRFREDLLARINLWTFRLPGLRDRGEDIEPNVTYELDQFAASAGTKITFNTEARRRFLAFAMAPEAAWCGNFRDLNAAIVRMGTLAPGGRITPNIVDDEITRLKASWPQHGDIGQSTSGDTIDTLATLLGNKGLKTLDLFDRVQLATVVAICRRSRSLSEAGRTLYAVSRQAKKSANDANRLRKYLLRFNLTWADITGTAED